MQLDVVTALPLVYMRPLCIKRFLLWLHATSWYTCAPVGWGFVRCAGGFVWLAVVAAFSTKGVCPWLAPYAVVHFFIFAF